MADVRTNQAAYDRWLEQEVIPYAENVGLRVETQAKMNATGIPVTGANNPEGRGPRVRTGRLRSSITYYVGVDSMGVYVDIGTPVRYGYFLETGLVNGATYPFLRPALSAI